MIALPHNRGFDTAAVDGNSPPDYLAAYAAGARFVYLKRSQHVYPDSYYERAVERARKAELVVGAYHFPGWGTRAAGAKQQIAAFRAAGGDVVKGVDLPPAIDVESGGGTAWSGVPKATLVEQVRQLVLEVQDQLGVWPAIYTSYMQWYDLGLPAAPWAVKCPLWIKTAYRLPARSQVDVVDPPTPHFGPNQSDVYHARDYYRCPDAWASVGWWIQQFQGDSIGFPGHDKTVDVNLFHTVRPGDVGPHVSWVQGKLGLGQTGIYDAATAAIVSELQMREKLRVDEIIGPATFARLAWM